MSLPGPYPTTPEERAAAAKKYGMRVEDYEPYPDDGWGWGDYPQLPKQHADDRDPHGDWDFPEERRNWGEAVSPSNLDFQSLMLLSSSFYNISRSRRDRWGTTEDLTANFLHPSLSSALLLQTGLMPLGQHPFGLPHDAQNSHFPYPELNPIPKTKTPTLILILTH